MALAFLAALLFIDVVKSRHSQNVAPPSEKPFVTGKSVVGTQDPGKIAQFEISIPKIEVAVPVVPNVDGTSEKAYDEALKMGVAHFQGTGLPSAGSNIFIFGHSSSVFGTGKYDKIFAKLNNLAAGDTVTLNFNNKAYNYTVASKKVISATDTSVIAPTDSEQLTLMTCWPVGSDQKRLVVVSYPGK